MSSLIVCLFKLSFALISLFMIGYVPVYFLFFYRDGFLEYRSFSGRFYIFFISLYTGIFIASQYLMIISLLGFKFSLLNIIIFSSVFFILSLILFIKKEIIVKKIPQEIGMNIDEGIGLHRWPTIKKILNNKKLINLIFPIIILFICLDIFIVVFFTFLFPVRFWDAISCWSLKGRSFFIDGNITTFFTGHNYEFSHQSYPLFLPLSQTWSYIWIGKIDETAIKLIFPFFYLSLIFIFYYLFKERLSRIFSLVLVFILCSLPIIMDHGYIEYADLIFSIVMFLGVYYFYRYILGQCRYKKHLIVSTLFFVILTQIKSEGMFFLILFLIANLFCSVLIIYKKYKVRKKVIITIRKFEYLTEILIILAPIALSIFLSAPWLLLKFQLGIPVISVEWVELFKNFHIKGISEIFSLGRAFKTIAGEIFYSFYNSTRAFLGSSYGVVWVVLMVIFILNFKKMFKNYNWIFLLFTVIGFISVFISIGLIEEFAWSVDRYTLHFFPLIYFWIFYNIAPHNTERRF